MSTYRSMIQVALCGLVVAASHLSAQSTPMWRYTATAEIALGPVTPIGSLLFTTPGQLVALDPATGTASWKLEDLQITGDRWWISALSWTPYGLLDLGDRLAVIDLQTGARRWDTTTLLIGSLKGYLAVPERLLLLVYGVWGSDSSVLAAVDVASGQVRWRHLDPFTTPPKRYRALTSGQRQLGSSLADESPALWVTDSTFLLYLSEDGPVLVNVNTGAFLWRAESLKGRRPPAARDLYPPSVIAESVAYIPSEKEVYAIRLRDGTPLWANPPGFPSRVLQLELTSGGLAVRGVRREHDALKDGSFVDLLDPATGASRWPKQFRRGWSVFHSHDAPAVISPFVVRGERLYCVTEGKLNALALGDGAVKELGKVHFKGDEDPELLENRPDGILLLSMQNVLLVDTSGAARYQSYYPAPPIGILGHIGSILLRVAFDFASYSLAQSTANRTGVSQPYAQYDNPFLRIRYAAAAAAQDYIYLLTSGKDSAGEARSSVVKVSKDRNRVEGRVWLSERHPDWVLDPIGGVLYVKTGSQEVSAFRF